MAFTPISKGSTLPDTTHNRQLSNHAAGFASRYGPLSRSPLRAFDTGPRPRPFPDETASLLPGLLTTTRTGLTPATDDERTSTTYTVNLRTAGRTKKGLSALPVRCSTYTLRPQLPHQSHAM